MSTFTVPFHKAVVATLFGLLSFLLAISPAVADTMPQYQGVYLRMNDGSLIKLPQISVSEADGYFAPRFGGTIHTFQITQIQNPVIVNNQNISAIVINGRNTSFQFLGHIVIFGASINQDPYAPVAGDNLAGMKMALDGCGWNQDNFNIQNIDAFNTVITPSVSGPFTANTAKHAHCTKIPGGGRNGQGMGIASLGRDVEVNNRFYVYFDANELKFYLENYGSSLGYSQDIISGYMSSITSALSQ